MDIFTVKVELGENIEKNLRNEFMDHCGQPTEFGMFIQALQFSGLAGHVQLTTNILNLVFTKGLVDPM